MIVVDASAIAAVLFAEPDSAQIAARLTGSRLLAPTLFSYELTSICATKLRREPAQRDATLRAFRLLPRFGVLERGVDVEGCLELASRHGLTAYDASYLWLSRHMGVDLLTLDRKLAAAAAAPP